MNSTVLYVEKDTDLMRSTFVAYGLADLLWRTPEAGSGIDVVITDLGSAYQLETVFSRDNLLGWVNKRGLPQLLPPIVKPLSEKERKAVEAGALLAEVQRRYVPAGFHEDQIIDYGAQKDAAAETRQARKTKTRQEGDPQQRHRDFPLWAHLCSYFGKGSAMRTGYPLALHAWHSHQGEAALTLYDMILNGYASYPNQIDAMRDEWQASIKPALAYMDFDLFNWGGPTADVSALSIISPSTAQGSYTMHGARVLNTGTPEVFWLEVYLAFAGFMAVGMPYNAGKDVLLYYALPRQIRFTRLRQILMDYRDSQEVQRLYDYSNFMPRAKVDALSQINFYISMVKHYLKNPPNARHINTISGVVGYYYKDISSHIPFDETTFAFPAWLPPSADATALQEALDILQGREEEGKKRPGHLDLIEKLRGDYAEELIIINHYRRFAAQGNPDNWIEFAITYSQHRFNLMEDSGWMPHLSLDILERTLMNYSTSTDRTDYSPIFETLGFQNIARAIRSCTVQLRYFKDVKKQQIAFKVRHGLGDDLRRSAHNADEFIHALGAFVHDYQRETYNVEANTGDKRPHITDEDLTEVVGLIPQFGSKVVANLLVAAGYASAFERKSE